MPELSIIVPVYNSAEFLRRTLSSVSCQLFKDFECIIIDDGSSDKSLSIAEESASLDSRFSVYHTEHRGVSAARNTGILLAKGKYIAFLDADDWIEPELYFKVINTADKTGADITQWNFTEEYRFRSRKQKPGMEGFFFPFENPDYFTGFVTTSVVRLELIKKNSIKFKADLSIGEDILFSLECFLCSSGNYFINDYLSHYRLNGTALSHNISADRIRNFEAVFRNFEDNFPAEDLKKNEALFFKIKLILKKMAVVTVPRPDYELFRNIFPEINERMLELPGPEGLVFRMINRGFEPLVTLVVLFIKKIDARYS